MKRVELSIVEFNRVNSLDLNLVKLTIMLDAINDVACSIVT